MMTFEFKFDIRNVYGNFEAQIGGLCGFQSSEISVNKFKIEQIEF